MAYRLMGLGFRFYRSITILTTSSDPSIQLKPAPSWHSAREGKTFEGDLPREKVQDMLPKHLIDKLAWEMLKGCCAGRPDMSYILNCSHPP